MRGRTVVPGLIDNHNHVVLLGLRPGHDTRLESATSIDDVLALLKARGVSAGRRVDHLDRGPRHESVCAGSGRAALPQGALRLAIEGEPAYIVHAGETFFEPPRAHHIISENASVTEPSRAIALMIVPEGEPLSVPEPE
jgi:hypothetical protein